MNSMEEGTADARPASGTPKASRSKVLYVSIATSFAVVLALSLGLGLGLPRDEDTGTDKETNSSLQQKTDNAKNTSTSTNSSTASDSVSNPFDDESPIAFVSRLTSISNETIKQTYTSCDLLNDDLTLWAQLIANRTIEGNEWYFDQPTTYYEQPIDDTRSGITGDGSSATTTGTEELADSPQGAATKTVSESNFGTNNQVEGVEEGDLVQSNGEQVFVVYGSEIIVLATDTVNVTSRTKIPSKSDECSFGYIPSILLIDDRLVVVATSYCSQAVATDNTATSDIAYGGQDTSDVYIYDIEDMSLIETVNLAGSFISARAVDGNVHIVTTKLLDSYALTQYLEPWRLDIYDVNSTKEEYRTKAQEQLQKHLPEFITTITQGLDCTSLQKLTLFQNSDADLTFSTIMDTITTVTSFNAQSDSISTSATSLMLPSAGYTVYASGEYLILAVQGYWESEAVTQQTYLISFKFDGPSTNVTSLGTVPGYILNQFSIDLANQNGENYLRVASTTVAQWTDVNDIWIESVNSTSQVTVLKMDDEASSMPVVGTVSNLGKNGETIYSVRFMGDRGFVTTFETTDPFYTLDLGDPNNPFKVGELEIPGFSSYLHPIGNSLILGVGQATDSNGTALGVQISLFDVSSFSNPIRIQNFSETGNSSSSATSYSEVEYDFKAFRFLNDSQLLIIPLTVYNLSPCNYTIYENPENNGNSTEGSDGGSSSSEAIDDTIVIDDAIVIDPIPGECYETTNGYDGFRVYDIATSGIKSYLSIEHDIADWTESCWSGALLPTRSLVFDGDLMTLKSHTILSHDLSTSASSATPINLDNQNTVCEPYILF